jgi:hypothetical protein
MNPDGSRFSMAWGRFCFIATWLMYCGVAFFFYRWAALTHRGFSEIEGFILLPSLAWLVYFIFLQARHISARARFIGMWGSLSSLWQASFSPRCFGYCSQ